MSNKDDSPDGCGCLALVVLVAAVVWAIWFSDTIIERAVAIFVALTMMGLMADKPKIY